MPSCIEPQESEILPSHLNAASQLKSTIMFNGEKIAPNEHVGVLPPKSFDENAEEVHFGDFDHASIPLEAEEWPIIIIGSSMVGMMTGLLLGYHG